MQWLHFQNLILSCVNLDATPRVPVVDLGHARQSEPSFLSKKIRFNYIEVQEMTNNFQRVLGEGGFGVVYHGCVNGTQQVAVKLLSQSSSQGYKHFKAEVLFWFVSSDLLLKLFLLIIISILDLQRVFWWMVFLGGITYESSPYQFGESCWILWWRKPLGPHLRVHA